MGLYEDEFGFSGVKPRRRRRTTIKHISIGPSNNQVITLLILAAAGGATAMYFVPQLPQLIGGLFKGTETPKSFIEKVKVSAQEKKSDLSSKIPIKTTPQSTPTRPPKSTNPKPPRTPTKTASGSRRANYTYYYYQNYL